MSILNFIFGLVLFITIIELIKPGAYKFTEQGLILNRRIKNTTILYSDISELIQLKPEMKYFIILLFGINFGWIGRWGIAWSRKLGIIHIFINKRTNPKFLIHANNKKYLISPNDEEISQFKSFLSQKIKIID